MTCHYCEGKGFIYIANGSDDYEEEVCLACDGTGKTRQEAQDKEDKKDE